MIPEFSGEPEVKRTSIAPHDQIRLATIGGDLFEKLLGRPRTIFEHLLTRTKAPAHFGWGLNRKIRSMSLGRKVRNTMVCVEIDVATGDAKCLGWAWMDDAVQYVERKHLDVWWVNPPLKPLGEYPL